MIKKSAFTLLELATVLIIISILIFGIGKGLGLIKSSRLNSARSITANSPINEIEGLIGWWETSLKDSLEINETYTNAQISTWHSIDAASIIDQTNSLTRTASSDVVFEEDGINDLPSISFIDQTISLSNLSGGDFDEATIFFVIQPAEVPTSGGTDATIFDSADSNKSIAINTTQVGMENSGSLTYTGTTNPASFGSGNNYIIGAYFQGSSSRIFLNDATTITGGSNLTVASQATSGITLGSTAYTGLISEVIIYNRPLKLQERIDVMRYLSQKYDIEVSGI